LGSKFFVSRVKLVAALDIVIMRRDDENSCTMSSFRGESGVGHRLWRNLRTQADKLPVTVLAVDELVRRSRCRANFMTGSPVALGLLFVLRLHYQILRAFAEDE
jgi:hypothetical protein